MVSSLHFAAELVVEFCIMSPQAGEFASELVALILKELHGSSFNPIKLPMLQAIVQVYLESAEPCLVGL